MLKFDSWPPEAGKVTLDKRSFVGLAKAGDTRDFGTRGASEAIVTTVFANTDIEQGTVIVSELAKQAYDAGQEYNMEFSPNRVDSVRLQQAINFAGEAVLKRIQGVSNV